MQLDPNTAYQRPNTRKGNTIMISCSLGLLLIVIALIGGMYTSLRLLGVI